MQARKNVGKCSSKNIPESESLNKNAGRKVFEYPPSPNYSPNTRKRSWKCLFALFYILGWTKKNSEGEKTEKRLKCGINEIIKIVS
jgi:hypothetical protein